MPNTVKNPNPTDMKSEANKLKFNDEEKPLDLSMPIYVQESDDEDEIIWINSDEDDGEHKENLKETMKKL